LIPGGYQPNNSQGTLQNKGQLPKPAYYYDFLMYIENNKSYPKINNSIEEK